MDAYFARRQDDDTVDYDPQFERDRRANDQRLKSRFEHIFEKYGRDFTGIGDEIDLENGNIVVDNGHLQSMRHEVDPGDGTSTRLMRAFAEDLENESTEITSIESEQGEGERLDNAGEEDVELRADPTNSDNGPDDDKSTSGYTSSGILTDEAGENDLNDFASDDEQSREFERASSTGRSAGQVTPNPFFSGSRGDDDPSTDATSLPDGPSDVDLHCFPGFRKSIRALQNARPEGQIPDSDAIEALGHSIARQIVKSMAKGPLASDPETQLRSNGTGSIWEYPKLPYERRRRTPSPIARPILPSSAVLLTRSPLGNESLWAPIRHPRPHKRQRTMLPTPSLDLPKELLFDEDVASQDGRRKATSEDEQFTSNDDSLMVLDVGPSTSHQRPMTEDTMSKVCVNCGDTMTRTWRTTPVGMMCNPCGMYHYRYGLLRPVTDEESSNESRDGNALDDDGNEPLDVSSGRSHSSSARGSPNVSHHANHRQEFSIDEDELIIKHRELEDLQWGSIARALNGRTALAVKGRYARYLHGQACEARTRLLSKGFEVFDPYDDAAPVIEPLSAALEHSPAVASESASIDQVDLLRSTAGFSEDAQWPTNLDKGSSPQQPHTKAESNSEPGVYRGRQGRSVTSREIDMIRRLRDVEKLPWSTIAARLPGEASHALSKRHVSESDQCLLEDNPKVTTRSGKLSGKKYTCDEDRLLLRLKDEEDLTWSKIIAQLPGRTLSSAKNRYYSIKVTQKTEIAEGQTSATDGIPAASRRENGSRSPDLASRSIRSDGDALSPMHTSSCPPGEVEGFDIKPDHDRASSEPTKLEDIIDDVWVNTAQTTPCHPGSRVSGESQGSESCARERTSCADVEIPESPQPYAEPGPHRRATSRRSSPVQRAMANPIALSPSGPQASTNSSTSIATLRQTGHDSDVLVRRSTLLHQDKSPPLVADSVNSHSYSTEEDELIKRLRERKGLIWSDIAARIPHADADSVASKYYETLACKRPVRKGLVMKDTAPRSDLATSEACKLHAQTPHDGVMRLQSVDYTTGRAASSMPGETQASLHTDIAYPDAIREVKGSAAKNRHGRTPQNGPCEVEALVADPNLIEPRGVHNDLSYTETAVPHSKENENVEAQQDISRSHDGGEVPDQVPICNDIRSQECTLGSSPIPDVISSPVRQGLYGTPARSTSFGMPYFVRPPKSPLPMDTVQAPANTDTNGDLAKLQSTTEPSLSQPKRLRKARGRKRGLDHVKESEKPSSVVSEQKRAPEPRRKALRKQLAPAARRRSTKHRRQVDDSEAETSEEDAPFIASDTSSDHEMRRDEISEAEEESEFETEEVSKEAPKATSIVKHRRISRSPVPVPQARYSSASFAAARNLNTPLRLAAKRSATNIRDKSSTPKVMASGRKVVVKAARKDAEEVDGSQDELA